MAMALYSNCLAQGYSEVFSAYYNYLPITISAPVKQQFPAGQLKATLNVPVYLKSDKSSYLLAGAAYENIRFSGSHSELPVDQVYGLQPTLGYFTRLNEKWSILALFQPSWISDFKNLSNSDIIYGGGVRATYTASPTLSFRFTMGYRQQFFGPQYLPLFGFDWQINDRWRMFGDLPTVGTLAYALNAKTNLGVYYLGNNYSFRLPGSHQYLRYAPTTPGLFVERYLFASKWAVRLTGSYCVSRVMNIYADTDKSSATILFISLGHKPMAVNPKTDAGPELKVTISYRM
jgi:hypothetical protein